MNTPNVATKKKKPIYKKWWVWLLAIIILRAFILYDRSPKTEAVVPDKVIKSIENEIAKIDAYFELGEAKVLDSGTIQIYVKLKHEPRASDNIGAWTNHFVEAAGKASNYDLNLRVSAIRPIEGTDKVKYYGTSTFYKDSGKIEFKEAN